jgi:hypothetical protein
MRTLSSHLIVGHTFAMLLCMRLWGGMWPSPASVHGGVLSVTHAACRRVCQSGRTQKHYVMLLWRNRSTQKHYVMLLWCNRSGACGRVATIERVSSLGKWPLEALDT